MQYNELAISCSVYISGFPVYVYRDVNIIRSGGIEIRSLKASQIPRRKPLGDPVLEKYLFVPHIIPANEKQVI